MSSEIISRGSEEIQIVKSIDDIPTTPQVVESYQPAGRHESKGKLSKQYTRGQKLMAGVALFGSLGVITTGSAHSIGEATVTIPAGMTPFGNEVEPIDYVIDYVDTLTAFTKKLIGSEGDK